MTKPARELTVEETAKALGASESIPCESLSAAHQLYLQGRLKARRPKWCVLVEIHGEELDHDLIGAIETAADDYYPVAMTTVGKPAYIAQHLAFQHSGKLNMTKTEVLEALSELLDTLLDRSMLKETIE